MQFYFGPMEGVGGFVFRRVLHDMFGGFDKYFSPFIGAGVQVQFHNRERRDVAPENNLGIPLVPQIMTNHADAFCKTARELLDLGYDEINLNLGCPSKTVIHKGKGAGFLKTPDLLDAFLDEVYTWIGSYPGRRLSIKTRLGFESPDEFPNLLRIFEQYPVSELIVHARVQSQYYNGDPDLEAFDEVVRSCRIPLCYNGNLFTSEDFNRFTGRFKTTGCVMMARGAVYNPAIALECAGTGSLTKDNFRQFHDAVFCGYREYLGDPRSLLFKMKELWYYMAGHFENNEKCIKKIKKAVQIPAYLDAVDGLFGSCPFK